jgi:hypothetical protein
MSPETTAPEAEPDADRNAETGGGTGADPGSLPPKAGPLVAYLRARVREEGACYLKSRFIAEDLDLSAKEVGAFMRQLQNREAEPAVEAWAYTNGTTWYVSAEE